MIYFTHIAFGLLIAFVGLIAPGMLNMTTLKLRIETGKLASIQFAVGASVVVLIQSGIALFFADYFVKNPQIIEYLKRVGMVVFFILSIVFFLQTKKKFKATKNNRKGNYFLKGMGMSSINFLAIPYYLTVSIFLASEEKIIIEQPYLVLFILGAAIGTFFLLCIYMAFATFINKRISFIAKNINYILSVLFLVLGILAMYKVLV